MEVWGDDSDFDSAEIENQYPSSGHTSDGETEVKGKGNFFGSDSESNSDDIRTIRPAQEKRFEEMKKSISKIESSMKIEDWGAVGSDWDILSKIIQKAKSITDKVGNPKFYLTFLCGLDDMINGVDKVALKAMKPKKAHYFNSTKKVFKRFLKDSKGLEEDLSKFRSNPDAFVDPIEPGTNEKKQKKKHTDSFGFSSNDDDDKDKKGENDDTENEKKNDESNKEDTKTKVPKEDEQPWTQERINKKLHEMIKERGKKNYVTSQVHEHIKLYRFLLTKIENNIVNQLYIQFRLINAQLDTNLGTSFLNINTWKRIYNETVTILDTLFLNPNIILEEETIEEENAKSNPNVVCGHLLFSLEKLHEEFLRSLQNIDPHVPEYLARLSHERDFLLLLQYAEKYYERQRDFKRISALALRQLDYLYYKRQTAEGNIEEIKVLKKDEDEEEPEIERQDEPSNEEDSAEPEQPIPEIVEQAVELAPPTKDKVTPYVDLMATVERLTSLVYRFCDDPLKRRATLQHIYHLALHDKFTHGRDLLFMTHLMEKINKARPPEQVMFNRAIVQLGLAAFREGRIEDASNCLQDILQNNKDKAKELLAQGIVHYPRNQVEKNSEQEKQERSRQVPYHMHINLDLVEAVLLVSGMLLEIPNLAQSRFRPDRDTKRKALTKYFRKSFDFYNERQLFTGPPENTKESIIVAAKGLERGDWVSCRDLIVSLDIWRLLPEPVTNVLDTLTRHIQEAALKTYLATYAQFYDTLYVDILSEMFNLPKSDVHSMVSSLMMRGELHASLDQPSGAIVVHGQDPTTLQTAALAFAEKANTLLDANDPATDSRGAFERRPHVGWTEQRPQRTGGGGGQQQQQQQRGRSDGQFNARSFERQFQTRRKVGHRGGGIRSK